MAFRNRPFTSNMFCDAQEGEGAGGGTRLLPRSRRARVGRNGMRVQGETQAGSPCAIFGIEMDGGGGRFAASGSESLLRCLPRLRSGLGILFCLGLCGELLPHLPRYRVGVYFVRAGSIAEHDNGIRS